MKWLWGQVRGGLLFLLIVTIATLATTLFRNPPIAVPHPSVRSVVVGSVELDVPTGSQRDQTDAATTFKTNDLTISVSTAGEDEITTLPPSARPVRTSLSCLGAKDFGVYQSEYESAELRIIDTFVRTPKAIIKVSSQTLATDLKLQYPLMIKAAGSAHAKGWAELAANNELYENVEKLTGGVGLDAPGFRGCGYRYR